MTEKENLAYTDIYNEKDDRIIPLDVTLKTQFERVFGADFSKVKIHIGHYSDRKTREAGAFALTIGNDIYFANGQYSPETISGVKLLAHELQHVVQYQNDRSVEYPEDINALETEASEIEFLFDTLSLHDIDAPVFGQTTVTQLDQTETASKTAASLHKDTITDEQLTGLDTFVKKDKSLNYTIFLPSNKKLELNAEEYGALKKILRTELVNYFNTSKNEMTNEEWESFVVKYTNFIRK
jgi:hypothetical protein